MFDPWRMHLKRSKKQHNLQIANVCVCERERQGEREREEREGEREGGSETGRQTDRKKEGGGGVDKI